MIPPPAPLVRGQSPCTHRESGPSPHFLPRLSTQDRLQCHLMSSGFVGIPTGGVRWGCGGAGLRGRSMCADHPGPAVRGVAVAAPQIRPGSAPIIAQDSCREEALCVKDRFIIAVADFGRLWPLPAPAVRTRGADRHDPTANTAGTGSVSVYAPPSAPMPPLLPIFTVLLLCMSLVR